MGETARLEGDGVRARGLSGILCTLLRLLGDLIHCKLLLSPCNVPGRPDVNEFAGELGPLESGEALAEERDCERPQSGGVIIRGERGDLILLPSCGVLTRLSAFRLLSVCKY